MPPRILVVDDNVDFAETLRRFLSFKGYEVRSVHSGESALRVAAEFDPAVILLDLGMPGIDGFQVAARLRDKPIVLVALTGYGQPEDRRRTAEAGFAHHLLKPADLDELVALLDGLRPAHAAHRLAAG